MEWLCSGDKLFKREALSGISKSNLHRDLEHVLIAIIENLPDIVWPDEHEREELANESDGVFHNCIGIMDVVETQISKPSDRNEEYNTFSGKYKRNTRKTLVVIDHRGYYRFVAHGAGGRTSDREMFTTSPLYMDRVNYFTLAQWLGADGIFKGDGPVCCSYQFIANDAEKELFNAIYTEKRKPVENALGRTESWFPILGKYNKYFRGNKILLALTIHASVRLHNWLLRIRKLDYNASTSPACLFRNFH